MKRIYIGLLMYPFTLLPAGLLPCSSYLDVFFRLFPFGYLFSFD